MNANSIANIAITPDMNRFSDSHRYTRNTGIVSAPIAKKTYFAFRSLSVLFLLLCCPLLIPTIASLIPSARLFRSLNIVHSPPTSIAPTPMYLTFSAHIMKNPFSASPFAPAGIPDASSMSGVIMTHPSSPPMSTNDDILGPIIHPTPSSAGEVATPP